MGANLLVLEQHGELGGGQRVLIVLLTEARSAGWQAVVVAPPGPLHSLIKGTGAKSVVVNWPAVESGPRPFWSQLALLAWNIRLALIVVRKLRGPFHIIVSNGPRTNGVAFLLGWFYRSPVVWYLHRVLTRRFDRTVLRVAFNLMRVQLLSVSRAGLDAIGIRASSRARVVHNGVTTSANTPREVWPQIPVIASVGRLDPQKGHSLFVEACRNLKSEGFEFEARVVGDPILWGADYMAELETECRISGVTLERLNGQPIMYSEYDIVVVASTLPEACPLVVLEAMANACVVVAANVGGIPELVETRNNGLLVPANSVEGLMTGIRTTLEDPKLDLALSRTGLARVRLEFSLEVAARKVMYALESWRQHRK